MAGQKLTRDFPTGPVGKPGDKSGKKLEGKLAGIGKRNPATVIGLGAVLVVVVVAMARKSSASSATAGTPSDQLQQYAPGAYDSSGTDQYNSFQSQLEALQQQIGGLTPPPATAGPPPIPTNVTNASFYKATKGSTWNSIAAKLGVFNGNGAALQAYNMLPNKHTSAGYGYLTGGPGVHTGSYIAIPTKGKKITLPGLGPITT